MIYYSPEIYIKDHTGHSKNKCEELCADYRGISHSIVPEKHKNTTRMLIKSGLGNFLADINAYVPSNRNKGQGKTQSHKK